MNWRKFCEIELGAVLDDHFPEGVIGRGDAVAIYVAALSLINKTVSAYGKCELCFGKGYGTQTLYRHSAADLGSDETDEKEPTMAYCVCDRGKQLERLVNGAGI